MAVDIIIPSVGESVTSGTLTRWTVKNGQQVRKDDVVAELETDKVTLEIRAPESGTLKTIAAEGATVQVGEVVGGIEAGAASPAPAAARASRASPPAPQASPAAPGSA